MFKLILLDLLQTPFLLDEVVEVHHFDWASDHEGAFLILSRLKFLFHLLAPVLGSICGRHAVRSDFKVGL